MIDVRSPKEFRSGHIAGAVNLPLFDDGERAQVGICFKQEGREAAIRKGLGITGPKLEFFITEAEKIAPEKKLALHCWRGGMRSKSMATLFDFAGFDVLVLKGGYKSYRRSVQDYMQYPWQLLVLGGRTGSGKTCMLEGLEEAGEQVLDLEKMAKHKGSAFGSLGEEEQPTTEMFENRLFEKLRSLKPDKRIWVEDESHLIGSVFISEAFWKNMRSAPVIFCDVPLEERVRYLVQTYGDYPAEEIAAAVKKITKRLGGQHAKAALENFSAGNPEEATRIVLVYYDKTYAHGLSQREADKIHPLEISKIDKTGNATYLIALAEEIMQPQATQHLKQ